jgi:Flp pilus assembly pilin Flp
MFERLFVTLQILRGEMTDYVTSFDNEEGATMVEYGLMVVGIAVVVAVAAAALGGRIVTMFNGIVPGTA